MAPQQEVTVGRSPGCDVTIGGDPDISRLHLRLRVENGELVFVSYGKNGTWLNGSLVTNGIRRTLSKGDTIQLASTGPSLTITEVPENEAPPEPTLSAKPRRTTVLILGASIVLAFALIGVLLAERNRTLDRLSDLSSSVERQRGSAETMEAAIASLTAAIANERSRSQKQFSDLDRQISGMVVQQRSGVGPSAQPATSFPLEVLNSIYLLAGADASNHITSVGTSFALFQPGVLCTNRHVVASAKFLYIKTSSGLEPVKLLYLDALTDVAFIFTTVSTVPLSYREPSSADIGEEVYAVGFPWASLTEGRPTVTKGVLSGYAESGSTIITDAAINHGNSGGPLIDSAGFVLGVNTAIVRTGDVEGGGFALNLSQVVKAWRKYEH